MADVLTPEHDKMRAIQNESQAIGAFLDTAGFTLAEYVSWCSECGRDQGPWEADGDGDCVRCGRSDSWRNDRLVPVNRPITEILADYFGIDLDKIEAERREILDRLQQMRASDADD